jgi:hypothetical protein
MKDTTNDATCVVAQCVVSDERLYELAYQAKDAMELKEAVVSMLEEEKLRHRLTSALIQCALDQVNWQEIWEDFRQQC